MHMAGTSSPTRGPFASPLGDGPRSEWLGLGLAVQPGELLFSEYEYLGGTDFAVRAQQLGSARG